MHDQEEARQLKNQLEKKVSDELAAQKAAEARTEDLLHRLESEKNHRLKIQTELAAARKLNMNIPVNYKQQLRKGKKNYCRNSRL